MWKRAYSVLSAVGTIGTIIFWLIAWASPTENRLLWWSDERELVLPSANFPTDISVSGEAGFLNPVYEAVVTVWKNSGEPLDQTNTRRPLVFAPESGSRILALNPIAVDVEEGVAAPSVSLQNEQVVVKWDVFDPGMAIKFAVLYEGSNRTFGPISDVGPNISVHQNYLTTSQYVIVFLILISGASTATYVGGLYARAQYHKRVEELGRPLNSIEKEMYLPIIPFLVLTLACLFSTLGLTYLALTFMRPAVPLALSSVTGL